MPSVNKTANLELNQWLGNEYPKRQDFVDDNFKIDAAIKEAKDAADSKAPSTHTHAIEDITGLSLDASAVNYSNTSSGLVSTKSQGAIDEVNAKAEANKTSISEQKKEIDSLKQSGVDGKTVVASAITAKGVPTLATDAFQTMATNITNIKDMPVGWDMEALGEVIGSNINENDAIVWQKYGNFETLIEPLLEQPFISVGSRGRIDFDKQGKFFAITGSSSPYFNVFKITGDTFTKLPNPSVLPVSSKHLCAFSPDGKYLAINQDIYLIEGDTFIKLVSLPITSEYVNMTAFSPDGKYFGMAGSYDNYVRLFKINSTTNVFTSVRTLSSSQFMTGLCFSPDSKLVHFVQVDANTRTFELSDIANPTEISATGTGRIVGMAHSNNGDLLAVSGVDAGESLMIYSVTGKVFTKLIGVVDTLPNACYNITFTTDDNYLIMSTQGDKTKSIYVYKRTGNMFTLINPISEPAGYTRFHAISPDDKFLAIQDGTSATTIHRTQEKAVVMNYNIPNLPMLKLTSRYVGVAQESKNIGEQINVNLFPKLNIK